GNRPAPLSLWKIRARVRPVWPCGKFGLRRRTPELMRKTKSMMLRKRVLVTGGAGFLGSHLCERLLAQGSDVLCVDNFFTGTKDNVLHLLGNRHFELLRHDVSFPCPQPGIRVCGPTPPPPRSMSRSTRSTILPAPPRRSITSMTRCRRPRP